MGTSFNCSPCGDQPREELVLEEEGSLGVEKLPNVEANSASVGESLLQIQETPMDVQTPDPSGESPGPVHVSVALKDLIERAYLPKTAVSKRQHKFQEQAID